MAAVQVSLHDLVPLLQIAGEAVALCGVETLRGAFVEHHHAAAGWAAPALLRRADQHIDLAGFHVHPHRARGDAVEHEQRADFAGGGAQGLQIAVGQHQASGSFHMRGEHHGRALAADGGDHLVDRRRCERRLRAAAGAAGLADGHVGGIGESALLDDLRPAVTEPAVAHDHNLAALHVLAGYRLHAEAAAAGHDDGMLRVVGLAQHGREVAHHALKALRHMVERAVGVDHRVVEQTVGIDVGKQSGHGGSPVLMKGGGRVVPCGRRTKSLARVRRMRRVLCHGRGTGLKCGESPRRAGRS